MSHIKWSSYSILTEKINTISTQRKKLGFQCKQFFIQHDQCAMKVGTDSLMLGSWCEVETANKILDIGTGSGILALMLAQRTIAETRITGLDIDEAAVLQARENGTNSPWADKLNFAHTDVNHFFPCTQFDCIVSNPPYFEATSEDSIAMSAARRKAREESTLTHQNLLKTVARLLEPRGTFYVVLPSDCANRFDDLADKVGLYCDRKLQVRSSESRPFIRQLIAYKFSQCAMEKNEQSLTIYDENGQYTAAYKALCRAYYLNF
ncbi:methyltransferase domain-containing protein [Alteromonadaceae bacterium M269]|nr:methyltransferase domain-containing protein [Alteromonadaceae bacterium M269]